jgi:hypothetical protein
MSEDLLQQVAVELNFAPDAAARVPRMVAAGHYPTGIFPRPMLPN